MKLPKAHQHPLFLLIIPASHALSSMHMPLECNSNTRETSDKGNGVIMRGAALMKAAAASLLMVGGVAHGDEAVTTAAVEAQMAEVECCSSIWEDGWAPWPNQW